MAYLVNISVRAERDLAHTYHFINAEDSRAAREWYRGLRSAILSLEESPTAGLQLTKIRNSETPPHSLRE
jgi:plasmid stabilization system protein ParE